MYRHGDSSGETCKWLTPACGSGPVRRRRGVGRLPGRDDCPPDLGQPTDPRRTHRRAARGAVNVPRAQAQTAFLRLNDRCLAWNSLARSACERSRGPRDISESVTADHPDVNRQLSTSASFRSVRSAPGDALSPWLAGGLFDAELRAVDGKGRRGTVRRESHGEVQSSTAHEPPGPIRPRGRTAGQFPGSAPPLQDPVVLRLGDR